MILDRDGKNLFRAILKNPEDNVAKLAFADWLEGVGCVDLARAYRYCAEHDKHPAKGVYKWKHHDWWSGPVTWTSVPARTILDTELHNILCRIGSKNWRYGGVHRAMCMLAKGLRIIEKRFDNP